MPEDNILQKELAEYRKHIQELYRIIDRRRNVIDNQALLLNEAYKQLGLINASPIIKIGKLIAGLKSKLYKDRIYQSSIVEKKQASEIDRVLIVPYKILQSNTKTPKIGVLLHLFYVDQTKDFFELLSNIPWGFSLYISTDTKAKADSIRSIFQDFKKGPVDIRVFPNKGRDIAPKYYGFSDIYDNFEFVLHLHSKKSPYDEEQRFWREEILSSLIGNEEIIRCIFELFFSDPQLGIIAPRNHFHTRKSMIWDVNLPNCQLLAKKMGIKIEIDSPLDFPAGSMFWARSKALSALTSLDLTIDSFEDDNSSKDGQLAHAIERLVFYSAEIAGYYGIHIASSEYLVQFDYEEHIHVENYQDLRAAAQNSAVKLHSDYSVLHLCKD